MSSQEKEEAKEYYGEELEKAWKTAWGQDADMLILDEAVGACSLGFIKGRTPAGTDWVVSQQKIRSDPDRQKSF